MPLVAPGADSLPPPAAANDCPSNHPQQSVSRRLWWRTGPAVTVARCFTMTAAPTSPRSWRPSRRSIFRIQVFLPRNGGLSRPRVRPAEKADPRHPAAPASPPTPTSSHARTSAMGRLHHYHRRDSDRTFVGTGAGTAELSGYRRSMSQHCFCFVRLGRGKWRSDRKHLLLFQLQAATAMARS
jgi:hypothetical protein